MSIKKKLGLGAASAALGLSLIGGGTFAFFNDSETINNAFASGKLDLTVLPIDENAAYPINFDLSNLKPGDNITRSFQLSAKNGSLAIKQVLMSLTADNFVDGTGTYTNNTDAMKEFLSQFRVELFKGVTEEPQPGNYEDVYTYSNPLTNPGAVITLLDLYNKNYTGFKAEYVQKATDGNGADYGETRLNIAPTGISVNPLDKDAITIRISFFDNGTNQNQFQNDSVKVYFNLEGTQFQGTTIDRFGKNGKVVQNEKLQFNQDDRYVGSKAASYINPKNYDGTNGVTTANPVVDTLHDVPNE